MAKKKLSPDNSNSCKSTVVANAFVQVIIDAQEDFYTRLGSYDGTPPLPSHLATFSFV
jgi:hypothetical protein